MFPTGEHRFFHLTWFVYPNKLLINNTNCIFCNSVDSTNVCSQLGSLVGTVAGSHPAQPAQLLRKEIEAMLGSGVRGAGVLAGARWQVQPKVSSPWERTALGLLGETRHFPENKEREIFQVRGRSQT